MISTSQLNPYDQVHKAVNTSKSTSWFVYEDKANKKKKPNKKKQKTKPIKGENSEQLLLAATN